MFAKRVSNALANEHVIPDGAEDSDDHSTCVSVQGFVEERKPKIKRQDTKEKKIETQFLVHHKTEYSTLCATIAEAKYLPRTRELLNNFKELLLLDIRFVAGCDIKWQLF